MENRNDDEEARQRATNEAQQPKLTRKRKPTVASVIRQMKRAGVEVAGCEVQRDGTVKVISGKPSETTADNNDSNEHNEWDTVQ